MALMTFQVATPPPALNRQQLMKEGMQRIKAELCILLVNNRENFRRAWLMESAEPWSIGDFLDRFYVLAAWVFAIPGVSIENVVKAVEELKVIIDRIKYQPKLNEMIAQIANLLVPELSKAKGFLLSNCRLYRVNNEAAFQCLNDLSKRLLRENNPDLYNAPIISKPALQIEYLIEEGLNPHQAEMSMLLVKNKHVFETQIHYGHIVLDQYIQLTAWALNIADVSLKQVAVVLNELQSIEGFHSYQMTEFKICIVALFEIITHIQIERTRMEYLHKAQERPAALADPDEDPRDRRLPVTQQKILELNKDNYPEIFCPITDEIMTDPVTLKASIEGHSYERAAIEGWLREHDTEPMTRKVLNQDHTLLPNRGLKGIIERLNAAHQQPVQQEAGLFDFMTMRAQK